ncbi:MAG: arsenate reductase ArsC [Planctomycetota bacterium]
MSETKKPSILFLCTGNSCRSQMAEGWAKAMYRDRYHIYSAGIEAHGLNPNAVQVMQEAGVDISNQKSQLLAELLEVPLDLVVTVCSHADQNCPVLPVPCKKIHVGFDDPPKLAKDATSSEAALDCYRRVRDEIRAFVERLPDELPEDVWTADK